MDLQNFIYRLGKYAVMFQKQSGVEKYGFFIGFVISYFLFTTVLFFVLIILEKLPESWGYVHIAMITIAITLFGLIVKRLLK